MLAEGKGRWAVSEKILIRYLKLFAFKFDDLSSFAVSLK